MTDQDIAARRAAFRALHDSGCFVIPNPWDIGSAMLLAGLGYKALASSSAGFAFSRGLPDTDWAVPRDAMLGHLAELVRATPLPVNADYESGYAHDPAGMAENVRLCAATGVAGLSIEDNTGDADAPLYDHGLAVERIAAAAEALKGSGVLLTARCEAFLVGHPDAEAEVMRRLPAFAAAGADVLYAPGLRHADQIARVVQAVAPKPVNLLISAPIGLTLQDAAALGVRRISVGSAFARAAWGGFLKAARQVANEGRFDALAEAEPFGALNDFFRNAEAGK